MAVRITIARQSRPRVVRGVRGVLHRVGHKKMRHDVGLWEGAEFRPMFGIMLGTRCHHLDCSFMATGPTHLARHVKLSHELRVSVKCELCGKKTFNMEKHMKIQHDKEKTLECEYCQKMFLTPFILKKHQETHTSLESRLQSCPKCGVEVTNMKQHERYVLQKDLPYSCDEEGCETRFTSKNHRIKHIESVHEKTKTECPQCGKIIWVRQYKQPYLICPSKTEILSMSQVSENIPEQIAIKEPCSKSSSAHERRVPPVWKDGPGSPQSPPICTPRSEEFPLRTL